MKRYFILPLLLCFVSLQNRAQQVLYAQDFEFHYQSNFSYPWDVTGSAGFDTWSCDVDYQIGGIAFPVTDDQTRVAGIKSSGPDSSVRLVTPPFSLASAASAFFKYKSYFKGESANGITDSAVVEITTDNGATWHYLGNAPVSPGGHYAASTVNLTPYAGAASVRIGFRYKDGGQGFHGWMIDDLKAYVPDQNDIALASAEPSDSLTAFAIPGNPVPISGLVVNNGVQPITAFNISYRIGSGAIVSESFTGLALAPLASMPFVLSQPPLVTATGRYPLKVWASLNGDNNHTNDSATMKFFGAAFIPAKSTVVENVTGDWYPFAPQQYVINDQLLGTDYPVTIISVHDGDVMQVPAYNSYLQVLKPNFTPYIYFDRRAFVIPETFVSALIPGQPHPSIFGVFDSATIFSTFLKYKDHFGFASLDLVPRIDGNGMLSVAVKVTPALDLAGNYRLALVITENNVKGTSGAYDQLNAYGDNPQLGPMGGFESLPDPVPAANMKYNFVARAITPDPAGGAGLLPASMQASTTYNATLSAAINQSAWVQGKLTATVLLLNGTDSTVLNAASTPLPALSIQDEHSNNLRAALYPNPASSSANLLYYLKNSAEVNITVEDMAGRVLTSFKKNSGKAGNQNAVIRTDDWAPGTYIVTIRSSEGLQSLKLTVLSQ